MIKWLKRAIANEVARQLQIDEHVRCEKAKYGITDGPRYQDLVPPAMPELHEKATENKHERLDHSARLVPTEEQQKRVADAAALLGRGGQLTEGRTHRGGRVTSGVYPERPAAPRPSNGTGVVTMRGSDRHACIVDPSDPAALSSAMKKRS